MSFHSQLPDQEFLDSSRFLIAAKRLANDLAYGTMPSSFLGTGIDYVQSRPYQPGDPVRSIDWRVTARTGKPYVKEFESTKSLPCYLLVDTSASMTVSSLPRSKYGHAVLVATGLALASLDHVSPVGLLTVGSRDLRVRPSLSRDHVLTWAYELRKYRYDEKTSLSTKIKQLAPMLVSTSLVIVLSDLHDVDCVGAIRLLAQKHDVCVLQFHDTAELGVAKAGFLRAREAETGSTYFSKGKHVSQRQIDIEQSFKRAGIDFFLLNTERPYEHDLIHFFSSRNILGRRMK